MLEGVPTDHPLVVTDLGPVVGTHTGPGTIGVCLRDPGLDDPPDSRGIPAGQSGESDYPRCMDPKPDSPASRLPGSNALGDLPTRGADWVDTVVELLRDNTVRPLTLVTRAVVFGIIVFAAAVVTIVLLSITLIRLLTVYAFDGRVWLSDLVVGVVFVATGIVAWSQRSDPNAGTEAAS